MNALILVYPDPFSSLVVNQETRKKIQKKKKKKKKKKKREGASEGGLYFPTCDWAMTGGLHVGLPYPITA